VIITRDEPLIRSILEDDSVIHGFNDGEKLDSVFLPGALYFYERNVGLFPAKVNGSIISMHAAIPSKNRGVRAIKSAKWLCRFLVDIGYDVIARVRYNDGHVKRFVSMVGFVYSHDKNNYHIYRYA